MKVKFVSEQELQTVGIMIDLSVSSTALPIGQFAGCYEESLTWTR